MAVGSSEEYISPDTLFSRREIILNMVRGCFYNCTGSNLYVWLSDWFKNMDENFIWKVIKLSDFFSVKSSWEVHWIVMLQKDVVCDSIRSINHYCRLTNYLVKHIFSVFRNIMILISLQINRNVKINSLASFFSELRIEASFVFSALW